MGGSGLRPKQHRSGILATDLFAELLDSMEFWDVFLQYPTSTMTVKESPLDTYLTSLLPAAPAVFQSIHGYHTCAKLGAMSRNTGEFTFLLSKLELFKKKQTEDLQLKVRQKWPGHSLKMVFAQEGWG